MAQKVIKIGKSEGLVLPKAARRKLGWSAGDEVEAHVDAKGKSITFTREGTQVDNELLEWTDKFIEEYKPALNALSDK